ncbi:MAG: tryptophan--tRNA ligase [Pseudomonadota bacterium]
MGTNSGADRVVSGMRPSGRLHLGNYHGALKNWVQLQHEYEAFYFVADWHAYTTHYEDPSNVEDDVLNMVIDWLACGIAPDTATVFVQSKVPEHAELHVLLSMITPLSWLERVPSYKDQQEKLVGRDLTTYGFLGYPLLQSADILLYRAVGVPVGEDQAAHVEMTREVARRFNFIYGREQDFEERAKRSAKNLGRSINKDYMRARKLFQEKGDVQALARGRELVEKANLTVADQDRLLGYLEGTGRTILVEPDALHTTTPKFPGLDGQKMSKSYGNTILIREEPDEVLKKIRTMPTDPARVRRTDPGTPEKCPVWDLHKVYSDTETHSWVQKGCTTAGIGCIDCKNRVADFMVADMAPIRERAREFEEDLGLVRSIIEEGSERAQAEAAETLNEVRQAMGLNYR